MEWWFNHRSKLIKKDKFEELVNQYAFDPSIAFLVKPPKAPEPLVAQTKKTDRGRSINSDDIILSSIQRNLLQCIQPLLKLLNETDGTNVRDPLSAGLAMLGATIHRIAKFRQSHYDGFLDNGYESLKDKEPLSNLCMGMTTHKIFNLVPNQKRPLKLPFHQVLK